jgi:hypothetical protein
MTKYVKRTGHSGDYKYWYEHPDGSVKPGDDSQQRSGKKEHAHRLVAGSATNSLDHASIAKETGIDEAHIKNLYTNMKSHKQNGRSGHDFDDKQIKEASGDTRDTRRGRLQKYIDERASKKVDSDKKMEELENSIADIRNSMKRSTIKEHGGPISKDLLDKVKSGETGSGKEVQLDKDELDAMMNHGTYSIMSGKKKDDVKKSDRPDKPHKDLDGHLIEGGYSYSKIKGKNNGEDSESYMVFDTCHKKIGDMARANGHESFVHSKNGKRSKHHTSGEYDGSHQKASGGGYKPNAEDYYSEYSHSDGTSTKFSDDFDDDEMHKSFKLVIGADLDLFKSDDGIKTKEDRISLIKSILSKRNDLRKATPNK